MAAYLYNAPTGVPGDITRPDLTRVEPHMLLAVSTVYAQRYGIPMAYNAGKISQWQGSNVAADFAGVLARSAPEISGNLNSGLDDTVPNYLQPQNLVVAGYVNVKCPVGTPAFGGTVYVRVVDADPKFIGDFEATSDSTNSVALTGVTWGVNGKDADNNTELRIGR